MGFQLGDFVSEALSQISANARTDEAQADKSPGRSGAKTIGEVAAELGFSPLTENFMQSAGLIGAVKNAGSTMAGGRWNLSLIATQLQSCRDPGFIGSSFHALLKSGHFQIGFFPEQLIVVGFHDLFGSLIHGDVGKGAAAKPTLVATPVLTLLDLDRGGVWSQTHGLLSVWDCQALKPVSLSVSMNQLIRSLGISVFAVLAMGVATGCRDKEAGVSFNPEFSINLMTPGPKWPNMKKIKPRERAAFEKYGKPDFFRLIWNRQGSIVVRDQFSRSDRERLKRAMNFETTWVYLERDMELVFTGEQFQERRLNDEIRLIAKMGDPEAVRTVPGGGVEWTFYSTGRIFRMVNGKIIDTREFPAMGGFLK
jgi:hypothetical protein